MQVEGVIAAGVPVSQTGEHENLPALRLALPNSSQYTALLVLGDSMKPEVQDRDIALIRKGTDWFLYDGRICAVFIDGEYTLKRLQLDAEGRLVVLQPLNQTYRPLVVNPHDTIVNLTGALSYLLRCYDGGFSPK